MEVEGQWPAPSTTVTELLVTSQGSGNEDEDNQVLSEVKRQLQKKSPVHSPNSGNVDNGLVNGHSKTNGTNGNVEEREVETADDLETHAEVGEVHVDELETEENFEKDKEVEEKCETEKEVEETDQKAEEESIIITEVFNKSGENEESEDLIDVLIEEVDSDEKNDPALPQESINTTQDESIVIEEVSAVSEQVVEEEVSKPETEDISKPVEEERASLSSALSGIWSKMSPGRKEEAAVSSTKPTAPERPLFYPTLARRALNTPDRILAAKAPDTERKTFTPESKLLDDSFVVRSEPSRRSRTPQKLRKCDGKRSLNTEDEDDEHEFGKRRKVESTSSGFLERWSPFKRRVGIQTIIPTAASSPSRFAWMWNPFGKRKTAVEVIEGEEVKVADLKTEDGVPESSEASSTHGCHVM